MKFLKAVITWCLLQMDCDVRGSGIDASQAATLWSEMVCMSIKCLNSACPNKYYANENGLCSVCRNNPTTLLLEEVEQKKMQQIEIYLQDRQAKAQIEQRENEYYSDNAKSKLYANIVFIQNCNFSGETTHMHTVTLQNAHYVVRY